MSTGPSLYYNGYGSYVSPKKFFLIKPLKEVQNKDIKNMRLKRIRQ